MTENTFTMYKNSDALTKSVKLFLVLEILLALIGIGLNFTEYELLSTMQSGTFDSIEQIQVDAEASDTRQMIVGIVSIGVAITSFIVFLVWIHRSNYNARQLGATDMEITPGWSVGWFFIPIANLWKPYQAMQEIWRGSHSPTNFQAARAGGIVSLWWGLWLMSSFLGRVVFRLSMSAEEIPELINVNLLSQATEVAAIVVNVVTFALVARIYSAQSSHVQARQF